jgi:diguanylate cyclase (GGDEF)-like protein/PAS domain S-box-containing protein
MINIDLFPFCVVIYKKVNNDFIVIDLNNKLQKTTNINKEDIVGHKFPQIFTNVQESCLLDAMLRVEKTGEKEVLDIIDHKENVYRKNTIIKLEDKTIGIFFTDISETKKLEYLLTEQRNTFQNVMKDSDVISIQGYNESHEVIYWNQASQKIYGYSTKEALGKKLEDLIIPKHMREEVYNNIENWKHNGVDIPSSELTLVDKYGNDVQVYSQHKKLQISANKYEMYCIDIDLRRTKKLQKELLEQRNFLRTIFDTIPDLIWAKDLHGKYITCNSKFEKFFGQKQNQIMGKNDFDFVDKNLAEFFVKNDKIALKRGIPTTNEEYLVFADGSYKGDFETIKTPIKDELNQITGVLGISRDISLRKNYEKQLREFANKDNLTGLSKRTILIDRLEQILKQRDLKDRQCAILFIDLDGFKDVNDTKGHHIGDELLIAVAKKLKTIVREGDTLARFGGDEFLLLVENINLKSDASKVAKKIIDIFKDTIYIEQYTLNITASIGISILPNNSIVSEDLLCKADDAMYQVKKHGKNGYMFYDEIKDHP